MQTVHSFVNAFHSDYTNVITKKGKRNVANSCLPVQLAIQHILVATQPPSLLWAFQRCFDNTTTPIKRVR